MTIFCKRYQYTTIITVICFDVYFFLDNSNMPPYMVKKQSHQQFFSSPCIFIVWAEECVHLNFCLGIVEGCWTLNSKWGLERHLSICECWLLQLAVTFIVFQAQCQRYTAYFFVGICWGTLLAMVQDNQYPCSFYWLSHKLVNTGYPRLFLHTVQPLSSEMPGNIIILILNWDFQIIESNCWWNFYSWEYNLLFG